jgi:ubiquinol-cytochrome c reductase iron-sulfur subunit
LHSFGKGANRTRRIAPRRPFQVDCGSDPLVSSAAVEAQFTTSGGPGTTRSLQLSATTVSSAEHTRRDFIYIATGAVGAVGAAAALWPFVTQMNPDASTIAAGAPVEVDLAPIAEGQVIKVFWRGKPIFISHRSKKEIDEARKDDNANLPDPEPDAKRVKQGHDQWLVLIGICTHLGCIPIAHQGDYGGWFCPCHGSQYDTSGRIRRGPAPANLPLPPYEFVSDAKIRVGGGAAA